MTSFGLDANTKKQYSIWELFVSGETMKPFRTAFAFLLSAICNTAAQSQSASNPVPGHSWEEFYPNGPLFPCSAYSIGGQMSGFMPDGQRDIRLARARAAGFTHLGPQYEIDHFAAADARRHHLLPIRTIGLRVDFSKDDGGSVDFTKLDDEITRQVHTALAEGPVGYWYLRQEELRHWRPAEMRYLAAVSSALRRADPSGRALFMYEPGHRGADDIALTGKYLDVLMMGVYTDYMGLSGHRSWVGNAMYQQQIAAGKIGGKRGPFFIPGMFLDPPDVSKEDIETIVQHDFVRALAAGAKGLVIFSFREQRENFSHYEAHRNAWERLTPLVCAGAPLGRATISGIVRTMDFDQVSGPLTDSFIYERQKYNIPVAAITEIKYDGKRFIIAANSARSRVALRLLETGLFGLPDSIFLLRSEGATMHENILTLPPLGVLIIQLKS